MKTFSDSAELGIDIETFSSVDIKRGAYAYSEAPDFEVLLISYKWSDDDTIYQIDCLGRMAETCFDALAIIDKRFADALTDRNIIKTAYNANFERTCLAKQFGLKLPPEQWRCTMILAAEMGLPRSLDAVGEALGLPDDEQKLKTGRALIQYFCKPCRPTKANGGRERNSAINAPEKWELFCGYNKQDVVTEQAILQRLIKYRPDKWEQDLWTMDQNINDNGVLLDTDMADKIVNYNERHSAEMTEEARGLTGLKNPNSLQQLKGWMSKRGVPVESLTKSDIEELLDDDKLPDDVRRVLNIRQALGKTSIKKYQTMLDVACADGRARGIMQFYGGHTGRWAGRNLQPQNLTKNTMPDEDLDLAREYVKDGDFDALGMIYGEPTPVFSQLVRTAFVPSPGCQFVVTDFSAIEARVTAWAAGEQWRLDVFENGGDIYCESASRIYHKPVIKHGINGELRQRGKVAELALGYGGGVGAMKRMDTTGSIPESEMQGIVDQWRDGSRRITRMWYAFQNCAEDIIREGGEKKYIIKSIDKERARYNEEKMGAKYEAFSEYFKTGAEITFKRRKVGDVYIMQIVLPSGRPITYWDPKLIDGDRGPRITYMTQNQTTRKWEREETYGGKLTENIIQSIARDCLAEKMLQVSRMGYNIVFHVHDEMIVDARLSDAHAAEIIDRVMATPLDWAPGLPLKGGTYECDFYRKD